jgi:K+-sensing histidine kinase KdpD
MRFRGGPSTGEKERPAWRTRLAAYALAVAFVLVAFAGTALLKQRWQQAPSFMFFVPAIALTAWRAGRGATVLATTLSLFLIDWFFLPPLRSLEIAGSTNVLDIIAFVILTATIIVATEALRRAHQLSERRAGELQAVSTRASKLLRVTTALSEATTAAEVTRVFLDQGLAVLEAPRGVLVRADLKEHEILGVKGYSPELEAHARALTADAEVPVMVALRTGEPIWLASAEEYRERFPAAVAQFGALSETQAHVALRLTHQDEVVGAMSLSFPAPTALGVTDRAFTLLLAQATAAALHRAVAYDAERERRLNAEVLAHAREEVLGVVAHDLRNPLNLISTTTQFLIEEDLDRPRRSAMLERCLRSVRQMNRLIADLLDTVRLQAGRLSLNIEDILIVDVVQQTEDTFRPLADAQNIAFRAEWPNDRTAVRGDPLRLSQVLGNLIGNALKFTPAGGTVTLRIQREQQYVVFRVEDTGQGIAPDQLGRVFEDFWQARKGDGRGIGLGLAIAKALVEAQGGTIAVESEPGNGTTFTFTLPASNPPSVILEGHSLQAVPVAGPDIRSSPRDDVQSPEARGATWRADAPRVL